jgi:hypothetical protein
VILHLPEVNAHEELRSLASGRRLDEKGGHAAGEGRLDGDDVKNALSAERLAFVLLPEARLSVGAALLVEEFA